MNNWISVDEKLPNVDLAKKGKYFGNPISIRVLCACKQKSGKTMVKEGYCEFHGSTHFWRIPGSIDAVTHWMYMPDLPTEEKNDKTICEVIKCDENNQIEDKKLLIGILKNSKNIITYQPNVFKIPSKYPDEAFYVSGNEGKVTIHFDKIVDEIYKAGFQKTEGKWTVTDRGCVITCSNCKKQVELYYPDGTPTGLLPYCPYCGSKNKKN